VDSGSVRGETGLRMALQSQVAADGSFAAMSADERFRALWDFPRALTARSGGGRGVSGDSESGVRQEGELFASYTQMLWMGLRTKAAYLPG